MAFKAETTLASLQRDWKAGTFVRAYLLGGSDTLAKEEALALLKGKFLGADPAGMGLDLFDGNDTSAGAILSAVHTLPFFGGRRLTVVRRAEQLAAADTNLLSDGLAAIPSTNALVLLWNQKPDLRSVLVQAVKSVGAVAVCWPPFENQLSGWIVERAEGAGKRMDRAAAQALLEAVGPGLPDLAQEISKLALFVGDRPAINVKDVGLTVGERATLRFMEWERAIWRRDRVRALSLLEILRGQGEPTEALLPQIIRAVQRLGLGKALINERRVDRAQMFERFRMRMRDVQEDFNCGVERWSWADFGRALDRLVRADSDMKSGRGSPDADLTRLVRSLTKEEATRG